MCLLLDIMLIFYFVSRAFFADDNSETTKDIVITGTIRIMVIIDVIINISSKAIIAIKFCDMFYLQLKSYPKELYDMHSESIYSSYPGFHIQIRPDEPFNI